jgi:hypothetical protein
VTLQRPNPAYVQAQRDQADDKAVAKYYKSREKFYKATAAAAAATAALDPDPDSKAVATLLSAGAGAAAVICDNQATSANDAADAAGDEVAKLLKAGQQNETKTVSLTQTIYKIVFGENGTFVSQVPILTEDVTNGDRHSFVPLPPTPPPNIYND